MMWTKTAILAIFLTESSAFMTQARRNHVQLGSSDIISSRSRLVDDMQKFSSSTPIRNMATVETTDIEHDVVTVDLSDGRDYPIYIGAEFDDKQGK